MLLIENCMTHKDKATAMLLQQSGNPRFLFHSPSLFCLFLSLSCSHSVSLQRARICLSVCVLRGGAELSCATHGSVISKTHELKIQMLNIRCLRSTIQTNSRFTPLLNKCTIYIHFFIIIKQKMHGKYKFTMWHKLLQMMKELTKSQIQQK